MSNIIKVKNSDGSWIDIPALKGADGISPHIGDNGNWFIGEEDTGVSAEGSGGSGDSLFHIFYDDTNSDETAISEKLLPILNEMYQEYLTDKRSFLIFTSFDPFGSFHQQLGLYTINSSRTSSSTVVFQQLCPYTEFVTQPSVTTVWDTVYTIIGTLEDGVISEIKWLSAVYVSNDRNFLSTSADYTEAFIPTEDYQPTTKKYVDDAIAAQLTSIDAQLAEI